MSVYRSIVKNFAANTFGMGVNFLNQIAMVPLFISFWGVGKYADWILITALSSFFAMSDLGLNRASNNEFVIKYLQKDYKTCAKLQTNAFFFILSVYGVFILVSFLVSVCFGFKQILGVQHFTEQETSLAFMLLMTDVFGVMYGRVYHGIYRATSLTHVVIVVDNVMRVLNLVVLFFGIYLKVDIVTMLAIYLLPTLGGILFKHFYSRKIFPSNLSPKNFDIGVLKAMVKPSLAFMFFPLGQAISSQGMVFVISTVLGAPILVAFTTTRTLVNFLRQVMNMLSTSINPEICAAYGRKDMKTIMNVYNRSLVITFVSTALCVVALLIVGPYIYGVWTKHAIVFNGVFFTGMLFVLLISCLSGLSSVIPLSTNTHGRFTLAFIISQAAGVLLCYIFLTIHPSLDLVPAALIITETLLFIYTLKENNTFLNIGFGEMQSGLWQQTRFLLDKGIEISKKARS